MSGERDEAQEKSLGALLQKSTGAAWEVRIFKTLESTMDGARELITPGTGKAPALVAALSQSGGRGRRGRSWQETAGALYVTYAFETKRTPAELSSFPLAAGLVLRDLFAGLGCALKVKWPNDLVSPEKGKAGGILIELAEQNGSRVLLCGVGINLASSPEGIPRTTSIKELCGKTLTPAQALTVISPALYEALLKFEKSGFAVFRDGWLEHAYNLGREVTLTLDDGPVRGILLGVEENGELALSVGGRKQRYPSGDLNLE